MLKYFSIQILNKISYFLLQNSFVLFLAISEIDKIIFKVKPQRMIYFIRHAESKYNIIGNELKTKLGINYAKEFEYITHKFSEDYFDV